MVPLGAVEATGVAGRGAEAERALGDGRAAALAGGAAGLGVLHGDGRLCGGRRRRRRHCGADDANGSGEEAEAGVSGEEGGEEHAMWGWTGGEVGRWLGFCAGGRRWNHGVGGGKGGKKEEGGVGRFSAAVVSCWSQPHRLIVFYF